MAQGGGRGHITLLGFDGRGVRGGRAGGVRRTEIGGRGRGGMGEERGGMGVCGRGKRAGGRE